MIQTRPVARTFVAALLCAIAPLPAQEQTEPQLPEHADCSFFNKRQKAKSKPFIGEVTTKVSKARGAATGDRAADTNPANLPTIDKWIFTALNDTGVAPTTIINDYEFIRRATFDLTGRPPTADRVQSFAADTDSGKRAKLVDELLAKPEWLDKWTMYFGDLLKNVAITANVRRYPKGVVAFNSYIRSSLSSAKPYNQLVAELIMAAGDNSHSKGELNWTVGGLVTGGPAQDIWDQQAANIAQTFLGIGSMNCLLCHNGRGHLDSTSLWGGQQTRMMAWQFASFLSHTETRRIVITPPNDFYWGVFDDTRYRTDYALNTTVGNRPARVPVGAVTTVAPVYPFSENGPKSAEIYRVALAREVTTDFQFARAAVNYLWKEFFAVGIVDPPDQFDPARLDPDNPPPDPWTLQPSNPRLLNALAQDFINSGYSIKALMKQIVTSQTYQFSSHYDGDWNAEWDKLFARKFVRRLWAEEVHDAIVQTSGIAVSYNLGADYGTAAWAMQFPETRNTPGLRNPITSFLDSFLRGNREDEERRDDGSIAQALNLMNDTFVSSRVLSTVNNGLLQKHLSKSDQDLVNTLFLNVLSRLPNAGENAAALANLRAGNRTQEAENLLWSLYNKVDFVFNY